MIFKYRFVVLILFAFIFFSCKKIKNCPAFNEQDLSYMPYKKPDTLTFRNSVDSIFEIYIQNINTSDAYSFECRDLKMTCPCINSVEILTTDSRRITPYVFLKMEQSDVSEMQYFYYLVQNFNFEFDFRNELPYIDQMGHMEFAGDILIGNRTYNKVVIINNFDMSPANISKVYFNKTDGLLRFVEKSSAMVWDIVN
ncbi:MAG: hypothetical protein PHT69_00245 [Bacteroidales bacterium]|nr:hypothetical protein [Bacteroidales bacterium]